MNAIRQWLDRVCYHILAMSLPSPEGRAALSRRGYVLFLLLATGALGVACSPVHAAMLPAPGEAKPEPHQESIGDDPAMAARAIPQPIETPTSTIPPTPWATPSPAETPFPTPEPFSLVRSQIELTLDGSETGEPLRFSGDAFMHPITGEVYQGGEAAVQQAVLVALWTNQSKAA